MNQRGKISPALRRFFAYFTWIAMQNIKPQNRFYRSADFLKYSRSKKRFPVILFFNAKNFSLTDQFDFVSDRPKKRLLSITFNIDKCRKSTNFKTGENSVFYQSFSKRSYDFRKICAVIANQKIKKEPQTRRVCGSFEQSGGHHSNNVVHQLQNIRQEFANQRSENDRSDRG